jgi:two-component system response regulator CpxR
VHIRRKEMPIVTLFSGTFCREETVRERLTSATGYRLVSDSDLTATAAELSEMPAKKIERAFSSKTSAFNKFTHEKEIATSSLRLAAAKELSRDNLVFAGFSTHLIPASINHVLRVCLIADMRFRVSEAEKNEGISPKEAAKLIHGQDEDRAAWVNRLQSVKDPWDSSLYDIIIPMDKTAVEEAGSLIKANLGKDILQTTASSQRAVEDFLLAAQVEIELAEEGHFVEVRAKDGSVTLTINKQVLALRKLEEELKSITAKVKGVRDVETKVGKDFYQADIYRRYDFEAPSRILLVDDEREFVTTLSERLLMRDMGSVVAYDGRSALDLIETDEPDVMILDLRMPGIDGIEVLRRVKKANPRIEVIILTGHGSEQDRKICMELGAFAYLQKPVDIDRLSDTLKKANEKARAGTDKT